MKRLILTAFATLAAALGAEPFRTDVFTTGDQGYAMFRIPGLTVTPKGALLAYAEGRKSSSSDWADIDIVVRRSEDGGATWSDLKAIGKLAATPAQNPAAARLGRPASHITYNNPVAFADRKKGLVHFIYCVEYMRAFYLRSDDDGRTFSAPVEITSTFDQFQKDYAWKVFATGPGHGIQLRNGRLLVPVWLSTSETNPHKPSVAATIYSDDHGKTWKRGDIAVPSQGEVVDPSETVAVQLASGRVMLNARTISPRHRRVVLTSKDGATKWSAPRFQQELVEPICFGSLVRHSGKKLLFVNPDNLLKAGLEGAPGQSRDRRNLTIRLSEDDGETWKTQRVIDPGWTAYADLNTSPDGAIYVLYERGEPDPARLRIASLTLVHFPLAWVRAGSRPKP
ncbi:MAG: glycoside hydrolase [Bryobacter sp.]|jgi:sialidase-1|nr:glycoside hydrolase [Bryobacter sp. CoA8 C33]